MVCSSLTKRADRFPSTLENVLSCVK